MPQITLTIEKEDVLLDNYFDCHKCPITKAIKRAIGNGKDTGSLNFTHDGKSVTLYEDDNKSYEDLLLKLFSMYKHMNNKVPHILNNNNKVKPIPVETFTHTLIW